jgi:hypothetical protein
VPGSMTDLEVRDILAQAMADVGADAALECAFKKTGVYVCDANEKKLSPRALGAFDSTISEYFEAIERSVQ